MKFLRTWLCLSVLTLSSLAIAQDEDGFQSAEIEQEEVGKINPKRVNRLETRIKSFKAWSFGFGPGGGRNLNNDEMFYTFSLGRHWEASEDAEIRARLGLATAKSGKGTLGSLGIGGAYFVSRTAVSPFLGGEFGIGSGIGDEISRTGFSGSLFGGMRVFRTSDTQMEIGAFYSTVFEKENPSTYGLQLAVVFQ